MCRLLDFIIINLVYDRLFAKLGSWFKSFSISYSFRVKLHNKKEHRCYLNLIHTPAQVVYNVLFILFVSPK